MVLVAVLVAEADSQLAVELGKENDGEETTNISTRLETCDDRSRSASPNGQRENRKSYLASACLLIGIASIYYLPCSFPHLPFPVPGPR